MQRSKRSETWENFLLALGIELFFHLVLSFRTNKFPRISLVASFTKKAFEQCNSTTTRNDGSCFVSIYFSLRKTGRFFCWLTMIKRVKCTHGSVWAHGRAKRRWSARDDSPTTGARRSSWLLKRFEGGGGCATTLPFDAAMMRRHIESEKISNRLSSLSLEKEELVAFVTLSRVVSTSTLLNWYNSYTPKEVWWREILVRQSVGIDFFFKLTNQSDYVLNARQKRTQSSCLLLKMVGFSKL